ncbi:Peroxiredoxin [Candidatus Magnetomoraceae bacterium gMMP-15]
MAEKLGIFVSSDQHLSHLINITMAAEKAGKEVIIFFTHKGVLLTQSPDFHKLAGHARYYVCNVNFEESGLKDKNVPGMDETGFATQARHGEIIEECDRYLVF